MALSFPDLNDVFLMSEDSWSEISEEEDDILRPLSTNPHPVLKLDLKHLRNKAVPSVATLDDKNLAVIDEIDVLLSIDVSVLDNNVALAWGISPIQPITVRLSFLNTLYLNGPIPKVSVTQVKSLIATGRQLENIISTLLAQEWPRVTNDFIHSRLIDHFTSCKCSSVRVLVDMGFAEATAKSALQQFGGCVNDAADYLLSKTSEKSNESATNHSSHPSKPLRLLDRLSFPARKKATEQITPLNPDLELLSQNGRVAKLEPCYEAGFLTFIYDYICSRLTTLNEFCVVCDSPHLFQTMLKPAVCNRELCAFSYYQLGVMSEADVATGAEVVELLVCLAHAALRCKRRSAICDPFPIVIDFNNPREFILHPKKKNFALAESLMDKLAASGPLASRLSDGPALKRRLDNIDPYLYPLLQWITASNRCHIVKLQTDRRLSFMHTNHQYLLLSSPPSKETAFLEAKQRYGSLFAFHGSQIDNWHSILRQGLIIGTGTKHQAHGAAYGKGIYLSPLSSVSFGYSNMGHGAYTAKRASPGTRITFNSPDGVNNGHSSHSSGLKSSNITAIALCEVINSADLHRFQNVWVCSNAENVCTRFLFVYEDGQVGDQHIDTQHPRYREEILRTIGSVNDDTLHLYNSYCKFRSISVSQV